MMKLIIQIPCLNEAETLPITLAELPKSISGIDQIEVLIIDDGSTDNTAEVARQHGVHYIVQHPHNKGLATAFKNGIDTCLKNGADIIVNTDADNQYPGKYIPDLVQPILDGKADMTIGDRQVNTIKHFSISKRLLQRLGSAIMRYASGTQIPDAPSGFRALSREAALRMTILTRYTYTMETIIQAGKKNLTMAYIPIQVNPQTRPSRLIKNNWHYVLRSSGTILRLFLLYEPLRTFTYLSIPIFLGGSILWLRFLILMLIGEAARGSNIQSVMVGAVAIIVSALVFVLGLLGDLMATNRRLHEETLYRLKKMELGDSDTLPSHIEGK